MTREGAAGLSTAARCALLIIFLAVLLLAGGLFLLFLQITTVGNPEALDRGLVHAHRHLRKVSPWHQTPNMTLEEELELYRPGLSSNGAPIKPDIQLFVAQITQNASSPSDIVQSTVMMTIIDTEGSRLLLPQFLASLCRVNAQLARQLLVICVSAEAFEACQQTYATCMFDSVAAERNKQLQRQSAPGQKRVHTPIFLQIGWDKLDWLFLALQKRAQVLFVDADIVWLDDPMPALAASPADVQLTHDGWGPNIGVMFLRPTNASLAFMSNWLARRTAPESRDQYEFQAAVDATAAEAQLQVSYVDRGQFPNGCCCGHALPHDAGQARRWVLWHAACVGGLDDKRGSLHRIEQAAAQLRPPSHNVCTRA